MKQPSSKKNRRTTREETAYLYERLSRDDNLDGDSYSIQNQKRLLAKVAKEKGYANLVHFQDDGVSGVTMDRPGFKKMMEGLEEGRASAVFVKDMSRLGRNYIEVGRLMEDYFPENDIRLVAVSDGLDTDEGENDLAPIRNLFNEWYARDISKKRRISNKIKGTSGEPLGQPPYGYMKDPQNAKRWLVDEDAAAIVRRIFQMTLNGYGVEQIAGRLTKALVLTPIYYWKSKGIKRPGKIVEREPHHWNTTTVIKILTTQEYCGDIINFKTFTKSYKNKKRLENAPEDWVVFKDANEAIIDRTTFELVQQHRGKVRKRRLVTEEPNKFLGLLVCADCGHNLHYHFNQKNHDIKYFVCANYKGNRGACPSTHYVRLDFLERVVLGEIRRLTRYATKHETDFIEALAGFSLDAAANEQKQKRRELAALQRRDDELSALFDKALDANMAGTISDERFKEASDRYDSEQAEVRQRIRDLQAELDKEKNRALTTDGFLAIVRRYTRARKLTARMLNELVERIEVYHAEKVDGTHVQRLVIHYNCIGRILIPDELDLPIPDVQVNTRKGVVVAYEPGMEEGERIA